MLSVHSLPRMTKHDIVDRIAQATGLTRVETEAVVTGFMVCVSEFRWPTESVSNCAGSESSTWPTAPRAALATRRPESRWPSPRAACPSSALARPETPRPSPQRRCLTNSPASPAVPASRPARRAATCADTRSASPRRATKAQALWMGRPSPSAVEPDEAAQVDGVFCNACGWKNPAGARFCSRCGTALQSDASAPTSHVLPPDAEPGEVEARRVAEPEGIGRRLGLLLGSALLLVAALFAFSVVLGDGPSEAPMEPDATQPPPDAQLPTDEPLPAGSVTGVFAELSSEATGLVSQLEDEIDAAQGAERAAAQRRMVDLLIGFGRPDLAAQAQSDLARETDDAIAYQRAGDLYSEWLDLLDAGSRAPIAQRAVAMYDGARERGQNSLDLRARQSWALQYDSASDPMRAIQETLAILEEDSLHIGGNFNRGWMNLQIGRPAEAKRYFARIVRVSGADTPQGRNAAQIIEQIDANSGGQPDAALPGR